MSQIDELLNGLSDEEIATYTADSEVEPHIVIGEDRVIVVPEELRRIAVQYDHNVETVTFDCPRYWDGHDLLSMKIYVNYMRADGKMGKFRASNVVVDADNNRLIHFNWTISKNVSLVNGNITFLACAKITDLNGKELTHWNSEINKEMYVSEGMETGDAIVESDPDIITQLLIRMDAAEEMVNSADVLVACKYYTETKELVEESKAEHKDIQTDIEVERARIDQLIGAATVPFGDHIHYVKFNGSGTTIKFGIEGTGLPTGLNKIEILSVDANYYEDLENGITFTRASSTPVSATLNQIKNDPTILGVWDNEYLEVSYQTEIISEDSITIAFKIDSITTNLDIEITSGSVNYDYELRMSSDTELYDIRIDADGKIHGSAGEAVRSQTRFIRKSVKEMNDKINNIPGLTDLTALEARVAALEKMVVDIENALKTI